MSRTRAERRDLDYRKAVRKRNIVKTAYSCISEWYDNLHQYSKNKIHCSCPMCAMKTNNKGKKGNVWEKPYSPPMHDKKQLDEMLQQEEENEKIICER